MSEIATSVKEELLKLKGKPADVINHRLKEIGDGDMLNGVAKLVDFAVKERDIKHGKRGIILLAGASLATLGIVKVKCLIEKVLKEHQNQGEEILEALNKADPEETADSQNATESVSDERDALSEQDETAPPKESA